MHGLADLHDGRVVLYIVIGGGGVVVVVVVTVSVLLGQQPLPLLLHQHLPVVVDVIVDIGEVGDHAGGQRRPEHVHVGRLVPEYIHTT